MADVMTEEGENETDKINVVPLADLSLVLLIILMVLSPMVMSSMIRVQSPSLKKTRVVRHEKSPDPLLIKVTGAGLFLNNTPIDSDQLLQEQIAIKLNNSPDRPVIISADDNVQVGEVVKYLDLAKQSGAEKVSLLKGGAGA